MPDERSPVQHALVLHRIDPDQGAVRFYSLAIKLNLCGTMARKQLGPDRHQRAGSCGRVRG
jgi:hypothetical protein